MRIVRVLNFVLVGLQLVANADANDTFQRKLQMEQCFDLDPEFNYFCPTERYCSWMKLSDPVKIGLTSFFGYNATLWDYEDGINEAIEHVSFTDLQTNQQSILSQFGYDLNSHDCCLGHYTSHTWSDFSDRRFTGVKFAWELLGYDERSWATIDLQNIIPPYGGVSWDELPDDVQFALSNNLCYNKELWDGVPLTSWTDTTMLPGAFSKTPVVTKNPTSSPTETASSEPTESPSETASSEPTESPTDSPTKQPTSAPTKAPTTQSPTATKSSMPSIVQAIETEIEKTMNASNITSNITSTLPPTAVASSIPTSHPTTSSPTSSAAPSNAPLEVSEMIHCRDLDPNTLYYCPAQRYCDWEGQTVDTKGWLTDRLGYERRSWNYYEINSIEKEWFEDLPASTTSGLEEMGVDIERHECCYNHYELYTWRQFQRWGLLEERAAWETVGYNQTTWDNGLPIDNIDFFFSDLPEEVQFALSEYLCYNKELWDEAPLDFWASDAKLPGSYLLEDLDDYYIPDDMKPNATASENITTNEGFDESSAACRSVKAVCTSLVISLSTLCYVLF